MRHNYNVPINSDNPIWWIFARFHAGWYNGYMKKKYSTKQKASIALAAIKGEKISVLSSRYQIHPNQITRWKNLVENEIENLFTDKRKKENFTKDRIIDELYKTIGQREVEISWLKKKFNLELPTEIDFGR